MRLILSLLICAGVVTLGSAIVAAENGTASVKLQDLTPADSQLKFQIQKIGWKYDKVRIWGVVTNTGTAGFQYVSVSFTALGKNGDFLVREKTYADPSDIGGNGSGVIDDFALDTEGQMPAIIQFKVVGDSK